MQPTTPTPSEPQQNADAPAEQPGSEPSQEGTQQQSWFNRLFRHRDSESADQASQDQAPEAAASKTLSLTQEELDKRIQAETDRREAKRANEARAAERRRLRDEDPWAYAEQERQAEKVAEVDGQVTGTLTNIGATHDRYTLDPLVEMLPDAEKKRILGIEGAGVGLDGRKLIVNESLKALEKHWRADEATKAESRLRRNPAFRKQLLNEVRTGITPEPEFVPSGNGSGGNANGSVSNLLREQLRSRH
jgi:hypothetical protein